MEESKKDKYKKFQTKKDSGFKKKSGATPDSTAKEMVGKVKKQNTSARGMNDYNAVTGKGRNLNQNKRAFGPKSTAPKIKNEAGSGALPSGTNTNLPNWGKRKDGSSGPC